MKKPFSISPGVISDIMSGFGEQQFACSDGRYIQMTILCSVSLCCVQRKGLRSYCVSLLSVTQCDWYSVPGHVEEIHHISFGRHAVPTRQSTSTLSRCSSVGLKFSTEMYSQRQPYHIMSHPWPDAP